MVNRLHACAALALLSLLAGCRGGPRTAPGEAIDGSGPQLGQRYFTQFPIRIDPRRGYRSTNFRTEQLTLLPVNTEVELLSHRGRRVTCKIVDSGREFYFEHVPNHSHDSLGEALNDVFGQEPVDLEVFSEGEREALSRGVAIPGMTRAAVLTAMGPPPASLNLNLDGPEWIYQSSRVTRLRVTFDNEGRVTGVGR